MDWWHLVPPALAVFAGGFLLYGSWLLYHQWRAARDHRRHGTRTTGKVVDVETEDSGIADPHVVGYPVVHFVDRAGRVREFRSQDGYSPWPEIGRAIPLWYDPDDDTVVPVVVTAFPSLVAVSFVIAGGLGVLAAIGIHLLFGALR